MSEEKDLQNLEVSEETKQPYDEKKLESLMEFDFSSDSEFNLEENYEQILAYDETKEREKKSQEEKTIEEVGKKYVDETFYNKLIELNKNLKAYFKRYDVNSDEVKKICEMEDVDKADNELTKLFSVAQFMLRAYKEAVNNLYFNINFTKEEYRMVNDIIKNKTDISGNETLLEGMDEFLNYLNEWKNIEKNTPGGNETVLTLPIDIKSVVLMYHFVAKKTVKGFQNPFYVLRSIMYKLKETNDVFEAYKTIVERTGSSFQIWGGAIDAVSPKQTKEEKPEEDK
jgi:hypothetical protein